MKIKAIQVTRFGVWQQLSLDVPSRGVALFYGPNEAGKTTLSRFIRSILYGFEPFAVELCDGTSRPVGWEGTLRVESQGHPYEIHRIADRGTRGLVSVVGTDREQPAESLLAELLHRTDESLFENVFAVGLNELQEMSTLQGDEVARHIYGLTLGPTGRRLLAATAAVEGRRRDLLDPATRTGRLSDLLDREQALRDEIAASRSLREEHAERCRERAADRRSHRQTAANAGRRRPATCRAPPLGARLAALARSARDPAGAGIDSRSVAVSGRRCRTTQKARQRNGRSSRNAANAARIGPRAPREAAMLCRPQAIAYARGIPRRLCRTGWLVSRRDAASGSRQEPRRRYPSETRPVDRIAGIRLEP